MKKTFSILIVLLFLLSNSAISQTGTEEKTSTEGDGFGLLSVNIGVGTYKPMLTYWNSESQMKIWNRKLDKTAFLGSLNLEARIYKALNFRVEGSFWKQYAEQSVVPAGLVGAGGSQKLELQIIPVSAFVLVDLSRSYRTRLYFGGGVGTFFMKSKYTPVGIPSQVVTETKGQDMIYYFVEGIRFPLGSKFHLGVEARVAFGSYTQSVSTSVDKKINLEGFQTQVSIGYKFN